MVGEGSECPGSGRSVLSRAAWVSTLHKGSGQDKNTLLLYHTLTSGSVLTSLHIFPALTALATYGRNILSKTFLTLAPLGLWTLLVSLLSPVTLYTSMTYEDQHLEPIFSCHHSPQKQGASPGLSRCLWAVIPYCLFLAVHHAVCGSVQAPLLEVFHREYVRCVDVVRVKVVFH